MLRDGDEGVGFYYAKTNDVVAPHKAYLPAANTESTADFIPLTKPADGTTTGIRSIEHSTFSIEHCYDLQGRRVAQPAKGLYIVGGKKFVK